MPGKTAAIDSTFLEANAAMKSIVRRDTGEDWNEYLRRLMKEREGVENPTDEELRRFDRTRKDKRVSNEEWVSKTDPDSRIAKMKNGRNPPGVQGRARDRPRYGSGVGRVDPARRPRRRGHDGR